MRKLEIADLRHVLPAGDSHVAKGSSGIDRRSNHG